MRYVLDFVVGLVILTGWILFIAFGAWCVEKWDNWRAYRFKAVWNAMWVAISVVLALTCLVGIGGLVTGHLR